jgi:hypothetical protein
MAQHATIHGKNSTPANGQSGTWLPALVDQYGNLQTSEQNLVTGSDTVVGRLWGGMAVRKFLLSATGLPTSWVGPGYLVGIRCITAGTIGGLYDNTSAAGTNFMPIIPFAAAAKEGFCDTSTAVYFDISPYFVVTSGTYVVFGVN